MGHIFNWRMILMYVVIGSLAYSWQVSVVLFGAAIYSQGIHAERHHEIGLGMGLLWALTGTVVSLGGVYFMRH